MNLSEQALKRVEELKEYYPDKKSAVMPILQLIQEELSVISNEAIEWLGGQLDMPPVHVQELVTFYSMYTQKPRGKYHFQVCRTLSCAVCGSKQLCEKIEEKLNIKPGEVSKDGMWSFEQVECLGSCGTAPVCEVNDSYFESLDPKKLDDLISKIEKEQPDLSFSTVKDDLGEGLKGFSRSEILGKK